jgi:hypothetical protein
VRRKRRSIQLSEEQQLIFGLILVILVAISLLYCLGFASLAVRQAWHGAPLPWNATEPPPENLEIDATPAPAPGSPGPTSLP